MTTDTRESRSQHLEAPDAEAGGPRTSPDLRRLKSELTTGLPPTHRSKRRAEVVIGDETVATIYAGGIVEVDDAHTHLVRDIDRAWLTADELAIQIAVAVGGELVTPRPME